MVKKNHKGVTLVELIIALALIGIIAITFLPMYAMGFSMIARSGDKSKAQFNVQSKVEQDLSTRTGVKDDSLSIYFGSDPSDVIEVKGEEKTQTSTVNGREVDITVFIPET